MPFSGYVYIEESFDTIFNMGYGWGAYNTDWPRNLDQNADLWLVDLSIRPNADHMLEQSELIMASFW